MALRDVFLNALGIEAPEVQKTNNSVGIRSARDFLINGNRDKLYPTWSDIKMSDSDMYRGYSYAVIQKRGNKVATLAKNNLKTWANPEIVDEYQKKDLEVIHPYLRLIEDSITFTEKQFWKNISIYLDLAGRYYLGVIRNQIKSFNPNLPNIMTDPTEFVMLNPYEIRRVIDKDKNVAGYIERKKDGRYREWPAYQIIEMRELNPFDPENSQWAMTDAAKNAVYTINQSGDYTRQSLHGNIDAPGIITTDVLLDDEDFANFRARVTQHTKGEPLFGNGTGAIKWDSMQIDLDKAALLDINEINRTELFAVSGTSKTSLGIEQSGTTRETSRVQSEQFVSDTAQPRLEDIVDFLNLDYKRNYNREYKKTGYYIEVESAVGKDYETEQRATELKSSQFQLAMQLIQAGYTTVSAYQFAEGQIDFADLELAKGIDKPKNPDQPEDPTEISSERPPEGPTSGSNGGDDISIVSENKAPESDLNELKPHGDLLDSLEGENGNPLEVEEVHCVCEHNHKIDTFINEVKEDEGKIVNAEYDKFLQEVREIEKETIDACARKVDVNAFEESDIIGKLKKAKLTEKLKNAIHSYWWVIFPLFAHNSMNKRNEEFDEDVSFVFNNDLQAGVDDNAERVAKGHMQTILNDILEASNRAYTNVREEAAAELIIKAYKVNPDKYSDYFDHEPTMADALSSIRRTDILEVNRKIYEKANQMAFEGYNRRDIIKAIRNEYKDISENRATLIAENETDRAFGRSQFEADKQFLNAIGKIDQAYKIWYSRRPESEQDKICDFCAEMIRRTNENPVPFEEPFLAYGDSMEIITNDGKVKVLTADYESIEGNSLHPRCQCGYHLVFKNDAGEFVKTLNGVENANTSNTLGGGNLSGGASDDRNNEPSSKELNGGLGSGNFGHLGRPGEVGGSSKESLASSETRTRRFMLGDTVKITSKGKEYVGVLSAVTSERTSDIEVELSNGKTFKMKVQTATLVQDNGEQAIVPFYNVKMVKNVDAVETTPEERRTKKQQEALDEVANMIKTSESEIKYFKKNCSEETAVALRDELKKAEKEGINLKEVVLQHNNRLKRAQARVVYRAYATGSKFGSMELQLSGKLIADGEYYKQKQQKNYDDGWHTSPDIAGLIRHELGHIKSAQIALRRYDKDNQGHSSLTSAGVSNMNEKICHEIVKKANPGYSVFSLSFGKKSEGKDVSRYALKEGKYSELVAESYSNPNYSQATKDIARVLSEEFSRRNNSSPMKITNEMNSDEMEQSLCTGYPMSEEDWEILHGKKPKEYIPDNIKLNER